MQTQKLESQRQRQHQTASLKSCILSVNTLYTHIHTYFSPYVLNRKALFDFHCHLHWGPLRAAWITHSSHVVCTASLNSQMYYEMGNYYTHTYGVQCACVYYKNINTRSLPMAGNLKQYPRTIINPNYRLLR